jgi:hypothetical protein
MTVVPEPVLAETPLAPNSATPATMMVIAVVLTTPLPLSTRPPTPPS